MTNSHLSFARSVRKFIDQDLSERYYLYGPVFPDIMEIVLSRNYQSLDLLFARWLHEPTPKSELGLFFSTEMIDMATALQNIEYMSFGYGMLSHFILDAFIHSFMDRNGLNLLEHFILELEMAQNDLTNTPELFSISSEFLVPYIYNSDVVPDKNRDVFSHQMQEYTSMYSLTYSLKMEMFVRGLLVLRNIPDTLDNVIISSMFSNEKQQMFMELRGFDIKHVLQKSEK